MKQRSLQYFRLPLQPSWQLPAMLSSLSAQVFLRGGRRCGTHFLGGDLWRSLWQDVWHRREPCSSAWISFNLLFKQITLVYVDT